MIFCYIVKIYLDFLADSLYNNTIRKEVIHGGQQEKPKASIDYAEKLFDLALGILEGVVLLVIAKYIK